MNSLWLILSSIACVACLMIITWLHTQHHLEVVVTPVPPPTDEAAPLISVMIPARNEQRNIRRCVEALLDQTWPRLELLVVDDRSTDSTGRILHSLAGRDPRLMVLQGEELPPGWAGKPHALVQSAQAAHGDWLCFVDADTFLAPEALSSAFRSANAMKADLFSLMTEQELNSFWERTILPLVFTALSVGFSPRRVNDPQKKDAIANGQFILIKRAAYTAVGGHAALRDSIVEDRDLAALVKRSGFHLVLADGRQVAKTRMYTSLAEMWEGWTKNIFLGLKGSPGLLLLGAFGAFICLVAALALPLWLLAGIAWAAAVPASGWLVALEAAAVWGYLLFWRALAARRMHIPIWYALTVPLGAGVFAAMMLGSTWKVLSGRGVTWKGRMYRF